MDKSKSLFKLADIEKFLIKRYGKNYKLISLKGSKNKANITLDINDKKYYLRITPYEFDMFEVVDNNKLTKVSENSIKLDWLKYLVYINGENFLKSLEIYYDKRDLEIFKAYNNKITLLKEILEETVAKKLALSKEIDKVFKEETILRTAIEDRKKEMHEELETNKSIVNYLNECEQRRAKNIRYMSKVVKEIVSNIKETDESKVTETEAKREVDTNGKMDCTNCK